MKILFFLSTRVTIAKLVLVATLKAIDEKTHTLGSIEKRVSRVIYLIR